MWILSCCLIRCFANQLRMQRKEGWLFLGTQWPQLPASISAILTKIWLVRNGVTCAIYLIFGVLLQIINIRKEGKEGMFCINSRTERENEVSRGAYVTRQQFPHAPEIYFNALRNSSIAAHAPVFNHILNYL